MEGKGCLVHCGLSGDRCECLKAFLAKQAATDLDRFKAAADALKDAANQARLAMSGLVSARSAIDKLDAALPEYRAARAAIEAPQTSE